MAENDTSWDNGPNDAAVFWHVTTSVTPRRAKLRPVNAGVGNVIADMGLT